MAHDATGGLSTPRGSPNPQSGRDLHLGALRLGFRAIRAQIALVAVARRVGSVAVLLGRVAEWQTRWLQVPVRVSSWGFKSPLAHGITPAQQGFPRRRTGRLLPDFYPCVRNIVVAHVAAGVGQVNGRARRTDVLGATPLGPESLSRLQRDPFPSAVRETEGVDAPNERLPHLRS